MLKYASFEVLSAVQIGGRGRTAQHIRFRREAHRAAFEYDPKPGYLYVRSRAISSRCNDNFDEFPAEEIKVAYRTFVGKPVFVNHVNDNHRRARGVIIDAALHEDTNPDGSPDTWCEVLMEVDAVKFPKLAEAIIKKHIERTSMGTDVAYSVCSFCGNRASTPLEYCAHIPKLKGKRIYRTTASGDKEGILVREICHGLSFFENSLLVEEPADPTAYFLGVDDRGVTGHISTAAALVREAWDESEHPRGQPTNRGQFARAPGVVAPGNPDAEDAGGSGKGKKGPKGKSGDGLTKENPIRTSDVEEAVAALAEGRYVELSQPREVSTLLDKLAYLVKQAKDAGTQAQPIDLCLVTVANTNLFCTESKGIPRVKMPQLIGKPVAGSRAAGLPLNANGEVDLQENFRHALIAGGFKVERGTEKASYLRASQNELNGMKVAGMVKAMEAGTMSVKGAPVFVSNDNYIVDGHHRWGALVGLDLQDDHLGDIDMDVERIDMDIITLLQAADEFCKEWGLPGAAMGESAEEAAARSANGMPAAAASLRKEAGFLSDLFGPTGGTPHPPVSSNFWKPKMTLAEADYWAGKGSLAGPWYHGTSQGASILEFGFDPAHKGAQKYGPGLYLTRDKAEARKYGKEPVEVRVHGKRVGFTANYAMADPEELVRQDLRLNPSIKDFGQAVKKSGYDVVRIGEQWCLAIDPHAVVVVDRSMAMPRAATKFVVMADLIDAALREETTVGDRIATTNADIAAALLAEAVSKTAIKTVVRAPQLDRGFGESLRATHLNCSLDVRFTNDGWEAKISTPGSYYTFDESGPIEKNKYNRRGDSAARSNFQKVWREYLAQSFVWTAIKYSTSPPWPEPDDVQIEWGTQATKTADSVPPEMYERMDRMGEALDRIIKGKRTGPKWERTLSGDNPRDGWRCLLLKDGGNAAYCYIAPTLWGTYDVAIRPAEGYGNLGGGEDEDPNKAIAIALREMKRVAGWTFWDDKDRAARGVDLYRQALSDTIAPAEVDTLRDEQCPVCGESDTYDGDRCQVCGFVKPPDEFMDPDLDEAKRNDLRQEEDEAAEVAMKDLACDNCGANFKGAPADEAPKGPAEAEGEEATAPVVPAKTPVEVVDKQKSDPTNKLRDRNELPKPGKDGEDPKQQEDKASPTEEPETAPKAGDPCPDCGKGKLQEAAPKPSDEEPGEGNPFAKKDEDEEDDDEDDEFDKDPKSKKNTFPPKKKSSAQPDAEGVTSMRPALAAIVEQQKIIEAQDRRIAALAAGFRFIANLAGVENHPKVAALLVTADEENPSQPLPDPAAEPPTETTAEALAPAAKDDVASVGPTPLTDVSPGATTDVTEPVDSGGNTTTESKPKDSTPPAPDLASTSQRHTAEGPVLEEPLELNEVDVTAPVAGTEEPRPLNEVKIETEQRMGEGTNDVAFPLQGPFAEKATTGSASESRTIASLRLARLRMQAGIAAIGDDLVMGTTIAASEASDEAIQSEIDTLAKVVQVQAAKPRQATAANRRLVPQQAAAAPSLRSGEEPAIPIQAVAYAVDDTEFLFE